MKLEYTYKVSIDGVGTEARFYVESPYAMLNYLLQLGPDEIKDGISQLNKLEKGLLDLLENWGHDLCSVTAYKEKCILSYTEYNENDEVTDRTAEIPTAQLRRLLSDWIKLF